MKSDSPKKPIRVLFVCIGNICRSPTAEAVFAYLLKKSGHDQHIQVDSAGMSNYHVGEPAHPRSRAVAARRNYDVTSIARQFVEEDFDRFDYILPMDESNELQLKVMAQSDQHREKILPFIQLCPTYANQYRDVPDPYYGGPDGFEHVLDICEEGCQALLDKIKSDSYL